MIYATSIRNSTGGARFWDLGLLDWHCRLQRLRLNGGHLRIVEFWASLGDPFGNVGEGGGAVSFCNPRKEESAGWKIVCSSTVQVPKLFS